MNVGDGCLDSVGGYASILRVDGGENEALPRSRQMHAHAGDARRVDADGYAPAAHEYVHVHDAHGHAAKYRWPLALRPPRTTDQAYPATGLKK